MSPRIADTWLEKTDCRILNFGVGLTKLSFGFAVSWIGASKLPKVTAGTLVAASLALDLVPTLDKGLDVDNSLSYRSKTASLVRGSQLATFIYFFSAAIDRLDVALEPIGWGWHILDSQILTQGFGGGSSGLFLLFDLCIASVSTEASRGPEYHARCPLCRMLDIEPTWDLPTN